LKLLHGDRRVDVLVRPESVHLCSHQDGTPAQVVRSSFRGTRKLYTLRLPSGAQFCGLFSQQIALRTGDQVRVSWHPEQMVTFSGNHAQETRATCAE
jgi:ABC-type Fe3+/spermidine/putrescine transport system ATPase subunit